MNKNVKINNPTLVDAWRQSNPHIVQFWWAVDRAVTEAVKYKHTTTEYGLTFSCRSGILFITLPSGRNLVYVKPRAMRRSLRREISMHLNIRTDKAIKDQAEEIFNELGLNMTTAVNMFLRTAIREHGIPFELKLEVPNDTTAAAIEDGRKMMKDPSAPRYSSMDALKAALDV